MPRATTRDAEVVEEVVEVVVEEVVEVVVEEVVEVVVEEVEGKCTTVEQIFATPI